MTKCEFHSDVKKLAKYGLVGVYFFHKNGERYVAQFMNRSHPQLGLDSSGMFIRDADMGIRFFFFKKKVNFVEESLGIRGRI